MNQRRRGPFPGSVAGLVDVSLMTWKMLTKNQKTSETVCGVVATTKEGRRRRRYLFDGRMGRSFQSDWQDGCKAPTGAQHRNEGAKLRDRV